MLREVLFDLFLRKRAWRVWGGRSGGTSYQSVWGGRSWGTSSIFPRGDTKRSDVVIVCCSAMLRKMVLDLFDDMVLDTKSLFRASDENMSWFLRIFFTERCSKSGQS